MVATSSQVDPPSNIAERTLQQSIAEISRGVFEPLCEETKRMLAPLLVRSDDTLRLRVDKSCRNFLASIYRSNPRYPGEMLVASTTARSLSSRLPECEETDRFGGELSIAATDISAVILHTIWPSGQIEFDDPETRVIYESLLVRWLHQTIAAKQRAEYKISKIVAPRPEHFTPHPDFPPTDYQWAALPTIIDYESVALLMQQGTGKTPVSIWKIMAEAASMRAQQEAEIEVEYEAARSEALMLGLPTPTRRIADSCYKVLVVVPKNLRLNWAREVHKFATVKGRVTVLRGGNLERIKLLCRAIADDPADAASGLMPLFSIVLVSYETLRRSWDSIGMVPWDLAVGDESHFFKSSGSKRFKTMLQLRDCSRRRMILTGTAITNSLFDLWAQLEFLGEGLSGFHSFKAFKKFYGKYEKNEYTGTEALMGYNNVPFIQERLARLAFMITKKEALPYLPVKVGPLVKEISMCADQAEAYKQLAEQLAAEIEGALENSEQPAGVTVNNALTQLLRLAQITAGFVRLDAQLDPMTLEPLVSEGGKPKTALHHFGANPKLEQLVADLKAADPHSKVIVYSVFVPSILEIAERLRKEGIGCVTYFGATKDEDREAAEWAFNHDDSVKVFIGNPAACGVGLNLWGYDPSLEPAGPEYDLPADGYASEAPGVPNCDGYADAESYVARMGMPEGSPMNCDTVIRFSSNWSMVQRAQSDDRPHRIGTRKVVTYYDYICSGTVDEAILERVTSHMLTAETIQDVREIMRWVLSAMPDALGEGGRREEAEVDIEPENLAPAVKSRSGGRRSGNNGLPLLEAASGDLGGEA